MNEKHESYPSNVSDGLNFISKFFINYNLFRCNVYIHIDDINKNKKAQTFETQEHPAYDVI